MSSPLSRAARLPLVGRWSRRARPGHGPRHPRTWLLVAGGGTMGHVSPGLAIAEAVVGRGCPRPAVHFVGSKRGVEATRVPDAGFRLTLLGGRGLQRRLTLANVVAVAGLVGAFAKAIVLVTKTRPAVVLALGGYASLPCGLAAVLLRIPVVVAEQNAVPGAANRLVGRAARACAISFEGTNLPRAVLTGNPVRPALAHLDRGAERAGARQRLGVAPDRVLLLAYGGSLGARRINRAVWDARQQWAGRGDLAVRHVVGDRDWPDRPPGVHAHDAGGSLSMSSNESSSESMYESPSASGLGGQGGEGLDYRAVIYEQDMATALCAADVVLSRAGASTVAELASVGVGSILVPLPIATGDHQTANARVLVDAGAAVLIPDAELDAARLVDQLNALLAAPDTLPAMAAAATTVGRPDAAERVADLLLRHARTPWENAAGTSSVPNPSPGPAGPAASSRVAVLP
ncbi:MAG: UDP-N-acetylglucosamine--N-acetylmuramyl-(pentapeptide) pyrophosphoryl-undecaprenol N-acetylglucosamine transferase [Acidimicrobiales bacterium]